MKLLNYIRLAAISAVVSISASSCHDAPDYDNSIYGNFDALWDIVDSRYCFFNEKDIDWDKIGREYRAKITPKTTQNDLFFICADMLDELQDGHVNLTSRFTSSYYRAWWSDYPQDFNLRTLEEYYLKFNWLQTSGISYTILPGEVGYLYYPSFSKVVGETSLDYILASLRNTRGLIIDIRDNGGGLLTNIDTFVGRFIDHEITGGYISHKTGPGHDDFSEPYPIKYKPSDSRRIHWNGPIVLLTNRSCYSAANSFASVMKSLPNVTVVGARTGGGGGLPFTSEVPAGWALRLSASPVFNEKMECIEFGIDPSPGCEVHASEEELAKGVDAIIDFALEMLKKYPLPDDGKGNE